MGKSIPEVRFQLEQVYKTYADQLNLAAKISNLLLDSTNIDSAGEQIEGSLRVLLANLLPDRVTVSHGYIVDKTEKISNQQDILITESFYSKSLIKSLDGTEFYPFESVFAIGEVKKTWSQTKLEGALKSIKRCKKELNRNRIEPNQLETGSRFISCEENLTSNAYRNPLFAFTFSIDYDKTYKELELSKIYNDDKNKHFLPNISIILNRGVIVYIDLDKLKANEISIKLYPEFIEKGANCKWVLLTLNPEQNLAYLIFMLTQHINDTILEKASTMAYGQTMINISKTNINIL